MVWISTQDVQKAAAVQPRVQVQTKQTQNILKTSLHQCEQVILNTEEKLATFSLNLPRYLT